MHASIYKTQAGQTQKSRKLLNRPNHPQEEDHNQTDLQSATYLPILFGAGSSDRLKAGTLGQPWVSPQIEETH